LLTHAGISSVCRLGGGRGDSNWKRETNGQFYFLLGSSTRSALRAESRLTYLWTCDYSRSVKELLWGVFIARRPITVRKIPVLGSPIPFLRMNLKRGKSVIWLFLGKPINYRID